MMPPHKKDLVEANIARIQGEIQREEENLADCLADAAANEQENLRTVGFVGTVEVETKGTARVWFGLTRSKDTADWIKIGPGPRVVHVEPRGDGSTLLHGRSFPSPWRPAIGPSCGGQPRRCDHRVPQVGSKRFLRSRQRQGGARPDANLDMRW